MRFFKKGAIIAGILMVVLTIVGIGGIIQSYQQSYVLFGNKEKTEKEKSIQIENLPKILTNDMIIGSLETQEKYGVPAALTLAQIILESRGNYPGGLSLLAYECNNLFGIKGSGTAGSKLYATQEYTGSTYITINEPFRKYNNVKESIEDHAILLCTERYTAQTESAKNDDDWAYAIWRAGYATDPDYPQKLINLYQTYDLYKFDNMTVASFEKGSSEILVVGDGTFCHPCPELTYISSTFGYREWDNSYHNGVDYAAPAGTPTYAAKEGSVIIAGWSDSAGNWVVIDHGNGFVTKYMHHSKLCVSAGQTVKKGQQIGCVGTTGYSSGNHLHFQLEINGNPVNPTQYM